MKFEHLISPHVIFTRFNLLSINRTYIYSNIFQDTMPTLKPIAKHSMYAPLMVLEALPNTPSSAQMEPSSTKSTSSVIGGLTSIAPQPKNFIPSTKTLLPNVKPTVPMVQLTLH